MSRFVVIYILCYEISAAFSLMIEVKSISNSQITFSVGFEQQSTEENRESAKPNYAIDNDAPC